MAKKQVDHAIDLRAELRKRVKHIKAELTTLDNDLRGCINERAHLAQFYKGRIERAEAELDYLNRFIEAW